MNTLTMKASVASLKDDLAREGLLLCDIKSVKALSASVWLESVETPCCESGSLLLIGHAGTRFWESLRENRPDFKGQVDPVDNYSAEVTQQAIDKHLPNVNKQRLFPWDDCPVNLMALGREFAWHSPSPLGMGIHETYGLWSAYRAIWWLDTHWDDRVLSPATNVCAQCETQECVSACPAQAIDHAKTPDLGRCADYRLGVASPCESTCLSRMACPYAVEHRYSAPQMRYHYALARSAIARYRSESQ